MLPLAALDRDEALALRGLLFDLDDTFIDEGRITEAAYSSLFRLREAGLELYIVTGRPLGWVRLFSRVFPIDGGVAENGGALVVNGRLLETTPSPERARRRARLDALVTLMRETFPDIEPVRDPSERLSDFAFDIGEEAHVDAARVREVAAFAREQGATVFVSSVHLHVGYDPIDKASGAVALLRALHEVDATAALMRYAFIGDSENDAACFAAFRTSIGVANLRGRPTLRPRFVTRGARGAGFAEMARTLGALRASAE
ncbi:MAG TPA: HAD hydrolase family protein [Polyangiaceae bacterium]|nr:HAD hydrolase family protein [Polyangiaceae bacterium]